MDAGEPLSGGVPADADERFHARLREMHPKQRGSSGGEPAVLEELVQEHLRYMPPGELRDDEIGPALEIAWRTGNLQRHKELLFQLQNRDGGSDDWGVGLPRVLPRGTRGSTLVTPEVALAILDNILGGQAPFRPELGVGGCSWFVTEGSPYVGVSNANTIPVQVEIINTQGSVRFEQADLIRLFDEEEAHARPEVEQQLRERFRLRTGQDAPGELNNAMAKRVAFQSRGLAERRMWEQVAAQVRASESGVGEVNLPPGGRFSKEPGRFKVVARAAKIRLRGGALPLLKAIRDAREVSPVPALEESAEELARRMRLAGRVRHVLRVGGKLLLIAAIAADVYEIITAEDRLEATVASAAGWAGATTASAAFTAFWLPADTAGPWAWAGHGVGVLASGAIGYWIGSSTTRSIYRLVVHRHGWIKPE